MAQTLNDFPQVPNGKRGRRRVYQPEWLDGQVWELTVGVDLFVGVQLQAAHAGLNSLAQKLDQELPRKAFFPVDGREYDTNTKMVEGDKLVVQAGKAIMHATADKMTQSETRRLKITDTSSFVGTLDSDSSSSADVEAHVEETMGFVQ